MKTLVLSLFLATGAAVALSADTPPTAAGSWTVHTSIAGNDSDMLCTFTMKEDAINGNCSSDQLGDLRVSGKLTGARVWWAIQTEVNGSPLTLSYDGALDASGMKGTVSVPEYGIDGEFTAKTAPKE